jgi:hypothetical protein
MPKVPVILNISSFAGNSNLFRRVSSRPFRSFPDAKRNRALFQKRFALRTFVRLVPDLHPVGGRNRTADVEVSPFGCLAADKPEAVQGFLKGWWSLREPRRAFRSSDHRKRPADFPFRHGIVKLPAIAAKNGLNSKMNAVFRATGHFGFVAAPGAFEQIRPAHGSFLS